MTAYLHHFCAMTTISLQHFTAVAAAAAAAYWCAHYSSHPHTQSPQHGSSNHRPPFAFFPQRKHPQKILEKLSKIRVRTLKKTSGGDAGECGVDETQDVGEGGGDGCGGGAGGNDECFIAEPKERGGDG